MFSNTMNFNEAYDELNRQLNAIYARLREVPSSVPQQLFHYTTFEGLNGITGTGRIWASNVRFLNDLSEPKYAAAILKRGIDAVKAKHKAKRENEAKHLLGNFWNSAQQQYAKEGPDAYAFCFCENGDLLSQWRGYAEKGRGCALGFDSEKLLERLDKSNGQYLIKAIYKTDEQDEAIESAVERVTGILAELETAVGSLDTHFGENARVVKRRIHSAVYAEVVRLQACLKSPAFQEEKEWRIVQFVHPQADEPKIRFRSSEGGIVPYLELQLSEATHDSQPTLPIESVVLGPTVDPALIEEALRFMFSKRGDPAVKVTASRVPFRS